MKDELYSHHYTYHYFRQRSREDSSFFLPHLFPLLLFMTFLYIAVMLLGGK